MPERRHSQRFVSMATDEADCGSDGHDHRGFHGEGKLQGKALGVTVPTHLLALRKKSSSRSRPASPIRSRRSAGPAEAISGAPYTVWFARAKHELPPRSPSGRLAKTVA